MSDLFTEVAKLETEVKSFNATQEIGANSSIGYILKSPNEYDYNAAITVSWNTWLGAIPNIVFAVTPVFDDPATGGKYVPIQVYIDSGSYKGMDLTDISNLDIVALPQNSGFEPVSRRVRTGASILDCSNHAKSAALFSGLTLSTRLYQINGLVSGALEHYTGGGSYGTLKIKFGARATAPGKLKVQYARPYNWADAA